MGNFPLQKSSISVSPISPKGGSIDRPQTPPTFTPVIVCDRERLSHTQIRPAGWTGQSSPMWVKFCHWTSDVKGHWPDRLEKASRSKISSCECWGIFIYNLSSHTDTPRPRERQSPHLCTASSRPEHTSNPTGTGEGTGRGTGDQGGRAAPTRCARYKKNAREKKLSVEQVQFPMEWRFWRRDRICCWEKEHAKVVPPTIHGKAGRSAKGLFTPSDKNIEKSGCEN